MLPTDRDEIKPIRPSFWSIQYIRDIFARNVAADFGSLGSDAVALLCMVAAEQDRERAKDGGPARLFVVKINEQLGWNDPHKFGRVLRLVVEAGWLQAARVNNRSKTSFWPKYPEEPAIDWPDGLTPIPAQQRSITATANTATTRSNRAANTARITAPPNSIPPLNTAPQRSAVTNNHKPTTTTGAAADLVGVGVHPPTAHAIVATHPPDDITDRLIEYNDAIRRGAKIGPGGLVSRFRDGAWPAEGIRTAHEIRESAAAAAKAAAIRQEAADRRKAAEAKAAQQAETLEAKFGPLFDALTPEEQKPYIVDAIGELASARKTIIDDSRPEILRTFAAAQRANDPKLRGTRPMQDRDRKADFFPTGAAQ